ncbi:alpha-hydroxy-acid oxidizing protein [Rhizobium sp. KVB221]|uniref:Alpha-hydroxy-acid oxidizing protein n=1 Tax=Rhizobium setariae TaxID=2801340 RepID=A0A936YT20_9HYPH|nr:alpha-hydroxy acid oxidase [Rhizobium setariae]MBL0372192.1 alpha-hydroxy-acid oxidizing protein [Rhizobium setariae]
MHGGSLAKIPKRFPSIPYMKAKARWRIPGFAWEYMTGGIGLEENVRRNADDLQQVQFMPRYLSDAGAPDISTKIFGQQYAAPFGVAPVGLAGLQWPGCEPPIAKAARTHNVVHVLSTHATQSLEKMKVHSGPVGWFQLYAPNDAKIEADMIDRAKRTGYDVLVVTVDIPSSTRRDRDIRNGLSVPPELGLRTGLHMLARPHWLARLAKHGIPHFENLEPYAPKGLSIKEFGEFLGGLLAGHITSERFKRIRDQWPGKIVVKGVLDPEEAAAYVALGADGIVVSNHGGRQLDAAPSSVSMLPAIRQRLGKDAIVMVDGGVRSGLDVARMLALGADYVFMGRPFIFASAAIGDPGPAHLIDVLKQELTLTMAQMGCERLSDLAEFLHVNPFGVIKP